MRHCIKTHDSYWSEEKCWHWKYITSDSAGVEWTWRRKRGRGENDWKVESRMTKKVEGWVDRGGAARWQCFVRCVFELCRCNPFWWAGQAACWMLRHRPAAGAHMQTRIYNTHACAGSMLCVFVQVRVRVSVEPLVAICQGSWKGEQRVDFLFL